MPVGRRNPERDAVEFQIKLVGQRPDLGAIHQGLTAADPAAIVDQDPSGESLRVATSLDEFGLLLALRSAGWPVEASQLNRLPSNCCGGCGG